MNYRSQIQRALGDLAEVERSRKHQMSVETLAQVRYLRDRGNHIGAYAALSVAVTFHGLNALAGEMDRAKARLKEEYGDDALVICNRAAIAGTRAVRGGDVEQLAREVAEVVPSAQRKLPQVKLDQDVAHKRAA